MPEKSDGGSVLPVVLIAVFFLLSVLEAAIIFNIGGLRDLVAKVPYIGPVIKDPELKAKADIEQQMIEINKKDAALKNKEEALNNREADLIKREKAVQDKETQLSQKENDLAAREAEINSKQAALDDMVKMYENMDDKQAAAIFSKLDDNGLIIDILIRMKKDKAAAILGQMDPAKAAELTKAMKP